ncbi:MAG: glycosyltransferase [Methanobrevibacter sp.]|nr:glycosyltransferase [Methanobrevibacter sp.]
MILYIIKKEKGNPKNIYKILKAKHRIKKLKLFDEKYYLKKYPSVKSMIDSLDHYIYHGYKEGKQPSKKFNGNYYLKKYSNVKKANQNPLVHYVLYGRKEGKFSNKESENNSLKNVLKLLKAQNIEIRNLKRELNKYSKVFTMKSVNKEKIATEIEAYEGYGITKKKRSQKLIVSLTSYPDRMYDIHYCLYSLLTQTCKPDGVILWLAKEQFPYLEENLPKKVLDLKNHGLTINWCEDIKSYKKLIYSLQKYPEDIIITADDDVFYPNNWLEQLYENCDGKNVVCHRAHLMAFKNERLLPYQSWEKNVQNNHATILNFFTGVGGVLYPPNVFYKDVLNKNLFMKLAPRADDIWFWAMAVMNNRKIKIVKNGYSEPNSVNIERELGFNDDGGLFLSNGPEGGNDKQLASVIDYYPEIKNKLKKEIPPKVSIIIPVYNAEKYLEKCLDSVVGQTLKDIEIICVNDESTDSSLEILERYAKNDKRIKVCTQKNQDRGSARNKGIKIAKGEYLGFIDNDDWVSEDYYEVLYKNAKKSNADISATSEVIFPDENQKKNVGFDGKNNLKSIESKSSVIIASGVMWNKIYRRTLIIKNSICFSKRRSIGEDNIFNILSIILSNYIVTTNKVTYFWRQRKSSRNSEERTEQDLLLLNNYEDILNRLSELDIDNKTKKIWEKIIYKRMQINFWWFFSESDEKLRKKIIEGVNIMFPKIKPQEYLEDIKND